MSGYLRKMARQQMKAGEGLMDRIVRDHQDVLQCIETALVLSWRESREVDDRSCHAAIESALAGLPARDSVSATVADALGDVRQRRRLVPDQVWQDALRVVAQSIRRHSSRLPGETNYLAFVDVFLP